MCFCNSKTLKVRMLDFGLFSKNSKSQSQNLKSNNFCPNSCKIIKCEVGWENSWIKGGKRQMNFAVAGIYLLKCPFCRGANFFLQQTAGLGRKFHSRAAKMVWHRIIVHAIMLKKDKKSTKKDTQQMIIMASAGAMIGGVVALLTASRSGSETRSFLRSRALKHIDNVLERTEQGLDAAYEKALSEKKPDAIFS